MVDGAPPPQRPSALNSAFRALEHLVRGGPRSFLADRREVRRFEANGPYDAIFYAARPFQESFVRSTLNALPSKYRVAIVRAAGREVADGHWKPAPGGRDVYTVSMHGMRGLRAPVLVTPQTAFKRRRLPEAPVRIHMPHSPVSLHMTYPHGMFAHFNVMFAVGEHHEAEYRAMYPGRRVYPVGYGRMDELRELHQPVQRPAGSSKHILIAPSWHDGNLLEVIGIQVVGKLLELGHTVVFRPHYRIAELRGDLLDQLRDRYGRDEKFQIDIAGTGDRSFFESDLLIGDYSGVAFEYAFLTERPVLFVDSPPKVRNPGYATLGPVPIELGLRQRLGEVVAPEPDAIVAGALRLLASTESHVAAIREARQRYCYNFESGAGRAAAAVLDRLMSGEESLPR